MDTTRWIIARGCAWVALLCHVVAVAAIRRSNYHRYAPFWRKGVADR